ncbi:hypothetical protein IE81DRAFT_325472 [Ceraceosorus guamensis]|uniref:Uncharacterized protein n=1 Tax=Ceraceosorus guamensis TaxID=1522189 RepID=A0A316VSF5_9BASI|nr:hypothetical protein IE81DRAFT_325472 [Ceraceosorus guamensis]PWN40536.1 hypothetical protein IE81DRAFT_325472 [Ceraceosorus guamensis]
MRSAGISVFVVVLTTALASAAVHASSSNPEPSAEVPKIHIGTPVDLDQDSASPELNNNVAATNIPKVHLGIKPNQALHFDSPEVHVGTPAQGSTAASDPHRRRSGCSKRSMSRRHADHSEGENKMLVRPNFWAEKPQERSHLSEKDQKYKQKLERIEWAKEQARHPPESYEEDGEHPLP